MSFALLRDKQCEIVSIYDVTSQGPPGWKTRRNGLPTCSFCLSAINHLGRVIKRLKEMQAQEDEPADSLMPAMQLIKRQLVEIFFSEMRVKSGNKDEVLEALKNNQYAK